MEGKKGFACIAFGSRAQVKDKAEEFRAHGKPTTLIKTFWAHYEEVCKSFGVERIGLEEFEETSPGDVLLQIRMEQPEVFAELERIRQSLWSEAPFNTWTLLVMTHKAAALWQFSILSRAWHHPDFKPAGGFEDHKNLAQSFTLDRIVFDDPKPDDFIEVMTGELYRFIADQQEEHCNWRNKTRSERLSIHSDLVGPTVPPFEEFNAMMRLNLDSLELVYVDFQAIPFGNDQVGAKGIYRPTHGTKFYLGPKEWLGMSRSTHLTIITTESLMCEIADKAIRKGRKRIAGRLNLTNLPGIYPIQVPAVCDTRAPCETKPSDAGRSISLQE
jgi:hypothetical protein